MMDDDDDDDDDSRARWLYRRCSSALPSLQTPLSAIRLSLSILAFVKPLPEGEGCAKFIDLRRLLTGDPVYASGMDFGFVNEICQNAGALRDDDELDEGALRAMAAEEGEGEGDDDGEGEGDDDGEEDVEAGREQAAGNDANPGEAAAAPAPVGPAVAAAAAAAAGDDDGKPSGERSPEASSAAAAGNEAPGGDIWEGFDDALHCFQLRVRLSHFRPFTSTLWNHLRAAGWTYSSGIYKIPKRGEDGLVMGMDDVTEGLGEGMFRHFDLGRRRRMMAGMMMGDAGQSKEEEEEDDGKKDDDDDDDDDEGDGTPIPVTFQSSNELVAYLDENVLPHYLEPRELVKAREGAWRSKSGAYRRQNTRLRFGVLRVAFEEMRRKEELMKRKEVEKARAEKDGVEGEGTGDDGNDGETAAAAAAAKREVDQQQLPTMYGYNHRPCEVCFLGSSPFHPRVACRGCGLVVHTRCYGLLDRGEEETNQTRANKLVGGMVDEGGFFTCDVCERGAMGKMVRSNKKRWHATQASGWRVHESPDTVCPICERTDIAGGMVRIVAEGGGDGDNKGRGKSKRSSRGGGSGEAIAECWAHLYCINSLSSGRAPSAGKVRCGSGFTRVQQALDRAAALLRENESMRERTVRCESCANRRGVLVECRGECERFYHRLCLRVDCVDHVDWGEKKEHVCLRCMGIDAPSRPVENEERREETEGAASASFEPSNPMRAEAAQRKSSRAKRQRAEKEFTEDADQYFGGKKKKGKRGATKGDVAAAAVGSGHDLSPMPPVEQCVADAEALHRASNGDERYDEFEAQFQKQFPDWSFHLAVGQSVLLYGAGSKESVLTKFGRHVAREGEVMSLKGYDPNADLGQFIDYVDWLFLKTAAEKEGGPQLSEAGDLRGLAAKAANFARRFASRRPRPLFILVHSIDGIGLRSHLIQDAIATLTTGSLRDRRPWIRVIASSDNVNSALLLWPPQVSHKFHWAWRKVSTHRPYLNEVRCMLEAAQSKKGKKSAAKQKGGESTLVLKVLDYVAPRHQQVLQLLAGLQRSSSSASISYGTFKEECTRKMLVASDTNLRSMMKELTDHKVMESVIEDGVERVFIPPTIPLQDILNFKPPSPTS